MTWLTTRRLMVGALVAWAVVAAIQVAAAPPLGHDEAAFAVSARGDAPEGAWMYRSEGTVVLARLGLALGPAAWQLRLASALLGVGLVLAVFAVGRAAFGARTGAWAAAVIAGAHPIALRSSELIGDIPAAACLLAGVAVVIGELSRDGGPRWRLVAAAPAFAAAFYLRYGSLPVIAAAGGAAIVVWWRALVARPLPALATTALLVLLLVPHALHSLRVTGVVLGILEYSANKPRRAYLGEGVVTYLTANPLAYYGALIAPLMVIGLAGLVGPLRRVRAAWLLALVALTQIVVLGLTSHAQPRYVFAATGLLVVLGVATLGRLDRARRAPRWLALALVAAAWLGAAIASAANQRRLASVRAPILIAATAIRTAAAGRPCQVIARAVPQLMWYSGCPTVLDYLLEPPLAADRAWFAVSLPSSPLAVEPLAAAHRLTAVELPAGAGSRVWLLRLPAPARSP